jgi:hypothetical protein
MAPSPCVRAAVGARSLTKRLAMPPPGGLPHRRSISPHLRRRREAGERALCSVGAATRGRGGEPKRGTHTRAPSFCRLLSGSGGKWQWTTHPLIDLTRRRWPSDKAPAHARWSRSSCFRRWQPSPPWSSSIFTSSPDHRCRRRPRLAAAPHRERPSHRKPPKPLNLCRARARWAAQSTTPASAPAHPPRARAVGGPNPVAPPPVCTAASAGRPRPPQMGGWLPQGGLCAG